VNGVSGLWAVLARCDTLLPLLGEIVAIEGRELVVSALRTLAERHQRPDRLDLGRIPAVSGEIFQNLEAFGFEVNNVHLHLEHTNGTTAKDTIVAIASGQDSVVIQMAVTLSGSQETLNANIELRDDNTVLFSGTQTVTARVGGVPAKPL